MLTQSSDVHFTDEAIPQMDILYNYALRLTRNRDDAADLLQETYLKAYHNWSQYQHGSNVRAWMFQIMKNSFINIYRKRSKRPPIVDYSEVQDYSIPIGYNENETNDPISTIFPRLLDDDVERALDSLPEDFRTVIILCDLEGLPYNEIAGIVRCPVGTVRSRLHRGRGLLRARLMSYARNHWRVFSKVPAGPDVDD